MTSRNANEGGAQPHQVVVRADLPEVRSRAPLPCRQSQSSDRRAGQEEVVPGSSNPGLAGGGGTWRLVGRR